MAPQVWWHLLVVLRAAYHRVPCWTPQGRLCQTVNLFFFDWFAVLYALKYLCGSCEFLLLCVCACVHEGARVCACECRFLQALLDLHGEWAETKGCPVRLQRRLCCPHLLSVLRWHCSQVFISTRLKQFSSFRPILEPLYPQTCQHFVQPAL